MNALIDAPSARAIYFSPTVPLVAFLATAVVDTELELAINVPNYPKAFPDLNFPIWDRVGRILVAGEPPASELKARASLAAKKARAFAQIVAMIALARASALCAFPQQDRIYAAKRREADRVIAYPARRLDPLECPYVLQYAELEQLEPLHAAREIELKARLADDVLLRSEYFRLKYCKLLRETESMSAIDAILQDMRSELYSKAM